MTSPSPAAPRSSSSFARENGSRLSCEAIPPVIGSSRPLGCNTIFVTLCFALGWGERYRHRPSIITETHHVICGRFRRLLYRSWTFLKRAPWPTISAFRNSRTRVEVRRKSPSRQRLLRQVRRQPFACGSVEFVSKTHTLTGGFAGPFFVLLLTAVATVFMLVTKRVHGFTTTLLASTCAIVFVAGIVVILR